MGIRRIPAVRILATLALALPILFSGLALPAPSASAESLQDQIAAARARQEDLRRTIERQREQLDQLQDDEQLAEAALDSSADRLPGRAPTGDRRRDRRPAPSRAAP
jgi:cell division protein FtsB